MLFSNTLKATAASLVLACAGVNAQSSWKSSQDLGLYVNPTKGISSNVTIGASPTSSLSKTRLTVKSEEGQGGLRIFNSAGDTKLYLNEKGGLSVGTSSSATTNGLLVSGQTRLRANLIVDNGAEIKGGMKVTGNSSLDRLYVNWNPHDDHLKIDESTNVFNVAGKSQFKGQIYVYDEHLGGYIVEGGETTFDPTDEHVKRVNAIKSMYGTYSSYRQAPLFYLADYHVFQGHVYVNYGATSYDKFTIGIPKFDGNSTDSPEYERLRNKLILEVWGRSEFNGDVLVKGKLSCKGQIEVAELKANDIQMDMHGAADYVFDENYNLKSLSEVENYVNEHKHLPGMPSAAEMEENGVSVSKMTNLLLEKVEELTLHMIQLEKENAALKAEVKSLRK